MRTVLARVDKAISTLLRAVAMFLVVSLSAIMALQVFQRFVVNRSLDWPDELAPVLLAWIGFVGAALAARTDQHVKFPLLADALPRFWGDLIRLAVDLIVVGLLSVYIWFSIPLINRTWSQMLLTADLSRGFLYAVVPVTSVIMIAYILRNSPLARWFGWERAEGAVPVDLETD